MKRLFIGLTTTILATILVPVSVHASALAFDAAGNLFVPDGHSISKYAPDGTKSTFATGLYPLDLCFDREGNLFVSDGAATDAKSRRSILKFTPDGKRSTFATGISSVGITFDRSGNLFVSQGDSISKFTPKGVKSMFVTSKPANFMDLAFDGAGNLFVADQTVRDARLGREIFKFSPDGTKTTFATGLETSNHLAVDAAGNVYVPEVTAADNSSHAILKFNPDGTKSTFSSALGATGVDALGVDGSGNVFASNDHSILKFDSSGTPSTFASDWLSPDKQWEYKGGEIVKAGTTQVVLALDQELEVYGPEAEILWAPDSKRFGFNYSPLHAHHYVWITVAFYELRGEQWVALPSLLKESERSQVVQLAKEKLPKKLRGRREAARRDMLKIRRWIDRDTAILYAYSVWDDAAKAAFLFTVKFDAEGKPKIVKTERLPEKEAEEEQ